VDFDTVPDRDAIRCRHCRYEVTGQMVALATRGISLLNHVCPIPPVSEA
jgi:hypothetical protein